MFHAIYTTCGMPCDDDPYTLLHAAIVAQAASDVLGAGVPSLARSAARLWLASHGITDDTHIRAIHEAFTAWKRTRDLVRS